jgi:hypothetical protein
MSKLAVGVLAMSILAGLFACSEDSPPSGGEQTGQSCTMASQCFPDTHDAALQGGPAVCMDRVPGGYCTHLCATDADCCAIPGECRTNYKQVCAPFQETNMKYCFLSCEVVPGDAGVTTVDEFCTTYAHAGLGCRSTGGGVENRKVCVPQ